MSKLVVVDRGGQEVQLEGQAGRSVMEIIRDGGVDQLLAMCGGSCSCATCHVYVEPAFASRLPPSGEFEDELLESSSHRKEGSRLACQIQFGDALDGMRVTIAPED